MAVVAFHSGLSETEICRLHLILLLRSQLLFIFTALTFVLLTFCSCSYFVRSYKVRTTRAANVLQSRKTMCSVPILPYYLSATHYADSLKELRTFKKEKKIC